MLRLRDYASPGYIPVPGFTPPWHPSRCRLLKGKAGRGVDNLFRGLADGKSLRYIPGQAAERFPYQQRGISPG